MRLLNFRWIRKIFREIKWIFQKISKGYSDVNLFDVGWTFAKFILPRLKAFRECPGGYCYPFKNEEEWVACIDKMIQAFEIFIEDEWFGNKEMEKEKDEGLELFAKYLGALWN